MELELILNHAFSSVNMTSDLGFFFGCELVTVRSSFRLSVDAGPGIDLKREEKPFRSVAIIKKAFIGQKLIYSGV